MFSPTSSLVSSVTNVEAFAINVDDLRVVVYQFWQHRNCNMQPLNIFRLYSHEWKTLKARVIQAVWRCYKKMKPEKSLVTNVEAFAISVDDLRAAVYQFWQHHNRNMQPLNIFRIIAFLSTGDFWGEELATSALDPDPLSNIPLSNCALISVTNVEAFAINTDDLRATVYQYWQHRNRNL
ncbi:hypothetical protein WN943_028144 [Citrus x changshan-huyou]